MASSISHHTPEPALQRAQPATPNKPVWKRDLYTISQDGHFIGHDAFVVPRSFEEFYERYPAT
jgi:hypothetical protein